MEAGMRWSEQFRSGRMKSSLPDKRPMRSCGNSGRRTLLINNLPDPLLRGNKVRFQPECFSVVNRSFSHIALPLHQFPKAELYTGGQLVVSHVPKGSVKGRNGIFGFSLTLLGKPHVGKGWSVVRRNGDRF